MQKIILLSDNMFDYIVRLLGWAVEGDKGIATPCSTQLSQSLQSLFLNSLHC